jgi:plasmid stabilization system protein ParE
LRSIYNHLKKENPNAARTFTKDLVDKLHSLAAEGVTGSPRDWVSVGLRCFPYRERCFYFRIVDDRMMVMRILHGKQDVTTQDFPEK